MQRVLVVGQSASGKSTAARILASHLAVPHVELDALFHGPGWVQRDAFADDVERATEGDSWVVDGKYRAVRDLLWSRADTVVWLDLPRTTTTRRAVTRTFRRLLLRVELWNGNRERLGTVLRATHPIRWTWQTHAQHRAEYEAQTALAPHLTVHRLGTPREVDAWLRDHGAT